MKQRLGDGRALVGPTIAYKEGDAPAAKPRCRMARPSRTGADSNLWLPCLLHYRLRLASLITAVPFVFFLIKRFVDSDPRPLDPFALEFLLQLGANAVIVLLTVYIWLRRAAGWRELRSFEMVLFGTVAAYFAWMQFLTVATDDKWGPVPENMQVVVFHLATVANILRWFFLIVVYGVFIPNTWKRCTLLTSATAMIPLLLTVFCALFRQRVDLLGVLSETGVVLAVAVAVAGFGSYRIQVLQQEAHEARQLGQYRLKKRLGEGGMGEVYLAEHVLLRRPCAVKLVRPDQTADPANLQRFEREVQAMATLTHWNTVEIFDYGQAEDGTFYYVMEYLPGQNLETLVYEHGPLPAARVIHFLRQVCRALREAHGIGLLHRDIKPSNIIACERGGVFDVAKLLDFGLVHSVGLERTEDKLTVVGSILGSPPYMSPEQAQGKHDLDARSDIYSVGAVAYFMLTGQPPYVRETPMMMLLAHVYEPTSPLTDLRPDVPQDLEEVVLRCLKKKPAERFPDADSLEKALAACQSAGDWSEDDAAEWWRSREAATDGDDPGVAPPTPMVKQATTN